MGSRVRNGPRLRSNSAYARHEWRFAKNRSPLQDPDSQPRGCRSTKAAKRTPEALWLKCQTGLTSDVDGPAALVGSGLRLGMSVPLERRLLAQDLNLRAQVVWRQTASACYWDQIRCYPLQVP